MMMMMMMTISALFRPHHRRELARACIPISSHHYTKHRKKHDAHHHHAQRREFLRSQFPQRNVQRVPHVPVFLPLAEILSFPLLMLIRIFIIIIIIIMDAVVVGLFVRLGVPVSSRRRRHVSRSRRTAPHARAPPRRWSLQSLFLSLSLSLSLI